MVIRLKGMGMPVFGKKDLAGDLYVKLVIELPQHLSEQEMELFRKLSSLRNSRISLMFPSNSIILHELQDFSLKELP